MKILSKITIAVLITILLTSWIGVEVKAQTPTPTTYTCGQTYRNSSQAICSCPGGATILQHGGTTPHTMCCGLANGNICYDPQNLPVGLTPVPTPDDPIDPFEGVTSRTFDSLNPLKLGGSDSEDITVFEESPYARDLSRPGTLINRLLLFAFPIAGLILFIMVVAGGFQILAGATSKKSLDEGKKRVTSAIVGFIILFSSYWIIQIIERILGLNILSS